VTKDGRVNNGLNLSRAIGDHSYKKNTALSLSEQMITSLPDIVHLEIDPARDKFMVLACDGIWNFMSSQEVCDYVDERLKSANYSRLSQIVEELFMHCLAPNSDGDGTGCDNMTCILITFQPYRQVVVRSNGGATTAPLVAHNVNRSGEATAEEKVCLKRTLENATDPAEAVESKAAKPMLVNADEERANDENSLNGSGVSKKLRSTVAEDVQLNGGANGIKKAGSFDGGEDEERLKGSKKLKCDEESVHVNGGGAKIETDH
jgi:hypothetical protein